MASPPSVALECRDVGVGYRQTSGEAHLVLTHVSFSVPEGGRTVLVGRSGSGKSTLLRALNRLEDPLAGTVLHRGRPITEAEPTALRGAIALVPQRPVVFEGTVADNFMTVPKHRRAPDAARVGALLEEVGLGADSLEKPAAGLSGGEQQRLCLARALALAPDVLLLDEPTSSLDGRALGAIAELVLGLCESRRLTLVVATHQPELVRRIRGDIVLVEDGTVHVNAPEERVRAVLEGP